MMRHVRLAEWGFHSGELSVQRQAGVHEQAERLAVMLAPAQLRGGIVDFLADRTLAVMTGRDAGGTLWSSLLSGEPGFLRVGPLNVLGLATAFANGDPLQAMPAGQAVGLVVIDFASSRRVRINGVLARIDEHGLDIEVEQAYGNCPQYIQQRVISRVAISPVTWNEGRTGISLAHEDVAQISAADTFFLGTTHPARGNDSSHRGGPAGFVRIEEGELWWPDYPGNNMFNSLGNLASDPQAALLFFDFDTGRTLHITGTAWVEWDQLGHAGDDGRTGRRVRFRIRQLIAGYVPDPRQSEHRSYPRNPSLT